MKKIFNNPNFWKKHIFGKPHDPNDEHLFHKMSLIALFAWIGLGADALSSSSYGPEEAFLALKGHTYLGIFVAIGAIITILVLTASYKQIIELFPHGGGGYLVASKLLSPTMGMIAGSALVIDYILTITISIAAGASAVFSFMPIEWQHYKLALAVFGIFLLILLNLRGIKESISLLAPIFITFIITHLIGIIYAITTHFSSLPRLASATVIDTQNTVAQIGLIGTIYLILHSYSMGAGTYTGIEAVSNGMTVLREPRIKTAKRTMTLMAFSLSFVVFGLMIAYLLYNISGVPGKTLNAVLFEQIVNNWGSFGYIFLFLTLISEAALLFVAAQTGFFGGPRVLANMAVDKWLPSKFTTLSDRFTIRNGILIMGVSSLIIMLFTKGSVKFLVVLYSINVFITFALSQLGMIKHWWNQKFTEKKWKKKIMVNGIGFMLSSFILLSVTIIKFFEGGWITLLITAGFISIIVVVRGHYHYTERLLSKYDNIVPKMVSTPSFIIPKKQDEAIDLNGRTAVLLVKGFNGLGLHTLKKIFETFGNLFKNYVFVEIGAIDAGNFKGTAEINELKNETNTEVNRYVYYMAMQGYHAEAYSAIGIDVVDEVANICPEIVRRFPNAVFCGGQIIFPKDTYLNRLLHNYTLFAMQRRLYNQGITLIMLPIKI